MRYLFLGFGSAGRDKAGGGRAGAAYARGGSHELQQVKRDVLVAPSAIAWGWN
jgi:hypothetical protein